jgi:hypothetical protein
MYVTVGAVPGAAIRGSTEPVLSPSWKINSVAAGRSTFGA